MQKHSDQPAATATPAAGDMRRIWRAGRCLQDSSAAVYLQWIKRFRTYCAQHNLDERAGLTLDGASRFIAWYAQHRCLDARRLGGARTALYALSRVYQVMGLNPPVWHAPQPTRAPAAALLREYAGHLARHSGNPAAAVSTKLEHIGKLFGHLAGKGKTWSTMTLTDIGDFLTGCAQRYARSTVAGIAGSVRSFTRFLLAAGHIPDELADSVISPVQPKFERLRRAWPWEDVQRLLLQWTPPRLLACAATRSC